MAASPFLGKYVFFYHYRGERRFIQEKGVHEYVSPSVCAIMSAI
ncbi:hypothetical protein SELSPUOL_00670 [Selenomonas sputigena ATCC 35185]|uniref:Uncharacterized protein n=1 Tax=Selenomonas sputigena (strain ATCC 35185 / DSM 20758 / CCUG 44933 / VPI D19B-28) TaxID=546271 RepID=C9LT91_SELS3|nr:hypothetical protein SELSPUOL_00670 [Selenomonas sputigena ATCC 35185]